MKGNLLGSYISFVKKTYGQKEGWGGSEGGVGSYFFQAVYVITASEPLPHPPIILCSPNGSRHLPVTFPSMLSAIFDTF